MKRLLTLPRWRPVHLPPARECLACALICASMVALGYSMATGDPIAALVFGALMYVLSMILDRPKARP